MEKYIKPNTEIYAVELQSMIAGSKDGVNFVDENTGTTTFSETNATGDALGKETTFSIWSDSDEEE